MSRVAKGRGVGGAWQGALLALVVISGTGSIAPSFREDEVQCEEAVAHLEECCDNLDATSISCEYAEGCETNTYPTLKPDESECVRAKSCSEIRSQGICERVLERQTADEATAGSVEVCQ
jgi:hypothetical protein